MRNECLAVALQELGAAGIRNIIRAFGSKHMQLRWQVNGTERMYVLPNTPSDVRAPQNTRADIRRLLREDGLLITERRPPPAPKPLDRITLLERRIATLEQRIAGLEQSKP